MNTLDSTDNDSFITNKILFFDNIIIKTIKSVQYKQLLEIIPQNEVKIVISDLLYIKNILKTIKTVEHLQEINNKLSTIFKQHGTESLSDLLLICYKKYNIQSNNYNILNEHFTPTKYKVLNSNEIKKLDINIKELENFTCLENTDFSTDILFLKIYGITVVIYDDNNDIYILINGFIDNISAYNLNEPCIQKTIQTLKQNNQTDNLSFNLYLKILSIKDILISNTFEILKKYNDYKNKAETLNRLALVKTIREYLSIDTFNQRYINIALLLDVTNQYSQYLSYLLYDMLSDESNKQYDSKKQAYIYNSLPQDLKQVFKNSIKNTLTYVDELLNFDQNKIPLEQQICLLKTTDNVKEKAMMKLKEIKSKSEDSGSKSRQYLDGLMKIPFGIYKSNKLIDITKKNRKDFFNIYNIIEKYNNITILDNVLMSEIIEIIWKNENNIEQYYINLLDKKEITQILSIKENLKYIKENHYILKNKKKNEIINYILQHTSIKKDIFYNLQHKHDTTKKIIQDISNNCNIITKEINNVTKILDNAIYGHSSAKRQIERIIAQWINGENSGYCLGFEGPPGIGKTSLAKKGIASCLKDDNDEDRPFSFIALGGSCNASTIDGHNYTYVGSSWGKIVDILMETKCMNPIIFIDELDKVSKSDQGKEIIGVLTHITDYSQNDSFQDKYFSGIDLDLSKVLFIFSYNDVNAIDRILLDRIHRVKFDIITNEDKIIITNRYILPELYKKMGISDKINISYDVIKFIIEHYTLEPGVRKLKELLFEIVGEINLIALKNEKTMKYPLNITIDDIQNIYLKEYNKINKTIIHQHPEIGIINGLWANAANNGGIMPIQATFYPSNNNYDFKLTGMQGDVMKESMNVAKSLAYKLFYEYNDISLNNNAIHVHCPDGATPKDGPSAGTAITLVIYSLLTNKKIKNDIAITGEINLFGNISEIGGLDLKTIGAYKANVKKILYPTKNQEDIDKILIKHEYLNEMEFIPMSNIRDIFQYIFI